MTAVRWRTSVALVGHVLAYLAVPLLVPIGVALWYGEDPTPFLATLGLTLGIGVGLQRLAPDPDLGSREAFLMVALTWLAVAVVGSVPYLLAGMSTQSTLAHPLNALFESMSGFTTTGATVMGEIGLAAEGGRHSHALLLWRQLTQWLGGMGIVVLAVAILPELTVGGAQLMEAEAPGPSLEKLTPRIAETARALWLAYLGLTVAEFVLLYALHLGGLAPNMTLYNAVAHALTTLPTGGSSPEARSIEAFSAAVQWAIIPFMVAAGTNFALIWTARTGDLRTFMEDAEFRFYSGVMGVVAGLLALLLVSGVGIARTGPLVEPLVGAVEPSIRHAIFQAVSIVTTTGYASIDFNAWGVPAQGILLLSMAIGGCAGSTGSAIKIVRWLVIVKSLRRELFTTVHPDAVSPIRLGGRPLDEDAVRGIHAFTLLYAVAFAVGLAVVAVNSSAAGMDLDLLGATSAVAATLGNVGPGFGAVGPMNSYLAFPPLSKLTMIGLMWMGRLEILPVLVLLTRAYWRS
jgi:trk system potassium uptake protein TrkH